MVMRHLVFWGENGEDKRWRSLLACLQESPERMHVSIAMKVGTLRLGTCNIASVGEHKETKLTLAFRTLHGRITRTESRPLCRPRALGWLHHQRRCIAL